MHQPTTFVASDINPLTLQLIHAAEPIILGFTLSSTFLSYTDTAEPILRPTEDIVLVHFAENFRNADQRFPSTINAKPSGHACFAGLATTSRSFRQRNTQTILRMIPKAAD